MQHRGEEPINRKTGCHPNPQFRHAISGFKWCGMAILKKREKYKKCWKGEVVPCLIISTIRHRGEKKKRERELSHVADLIAQLEFDHFHLFYFTFFSSPPSLFRKERERETQKNGQFNSTSTNSALNWRRILITVSIFFVRSKRALLTCSSETWFLFFLEKIYKKSCKNFWNAFTPEREKRK